MKLDAVNPTSSVADVDTEYSTGIQTQYSAVHLRVVSTSPTIAQGAEQTKTFKLGIHNL